MANVKITELTGLTANETASTDVLPVVDVSADATKKLAISDLHRSVPDGTLSAPGIAFQSDLNSGLYRSGTDAIALVTNGAARIQIAADGDVTIPNTANITSSEFGSGTAAAPSIAFTGDTDSGIYSPGANQVAVATNGTAAITVDSSQRVGIGTTSVSAGLHVVTDVNPVLKLDRGSANTTNANLYYNGTLTGQLSAANADFQISAAGTSTPISFYTNGSPRLTITSTGNAEFGGQVKADSTSGAFQASRSDGAANHVFRGCTSTSNYTSVITANGQLTLSGESGAFQATRSDGSANHIFRAGTSTSNYTTVITAGGAAYFASSVGIGTASPRGNLHLHSSSATRIDLTNTATGTA